MRIGLFTDTYVPEINGVVMSVRTLREGLEALGHEVWVFAPTSPAPVEDDDRIHRLLSAPLVLLPDRRVATPLDPRMLRRIGRLKLDVIHTHTEFGVGSFGFRADKKYDIPHVHTYHTIWEEYTHYFDPLGLIDVPAKGFVRIAARETARRCDRIIAPTKKTLDLLRGYGLKLPIDVIPTGVDLSRFSPVSHTEKIAIRKKLGIDRFEQVLLSIGRQAAEKSVCELLDLVAPYLREHPDTCQLTVGDGPKLSNLKRQAADLGIADQVIFTGEVPWEAVPDLYRAADVLIGNSHTETQGLTFIEAIASGTPIVVRYNTCFDGIIERDISGALFSDSGEFAPALESILSDEGLRHERIEAGLKASEAVSKDVFSKRVEESYLAAIAQHKKSGNSD